MKNLYRLALMCVLSALQPLLLSAQSLHSSTDSVIVTGTNTVTNWGRGFRFTPTQDLYVSKLGKRVPSTGTYTFVIWEVATQSKVHEQSSLVDLPTQYVYEDVTTPAPIKLTSGTEYIMELYGIGTADYYYGSSTQIGQHLIYHDQRYVSGGPNTFPTSVLTNIHYGTPDFLYSLTPINRSDNDAGVVSIDSIDTFCANTSEEVWVTVANYGKAQLNSVNVTLEINGIQSGFGSIPSMLDTAGGAGPNTAAVNMGFHYLQSGQSYDFVAYTSGPNSAQDTVNYNDTAFKLNMSAPACAPLQNVVVSGVTANSASLSWTPNICSGSFGSFLVEYGPIGFIPGGTGSSSATFNGVNSGVISNLLASTDYDVYVRELCTSGDSSAAFGPVGFMTPCVAITPPSTQSFNVNSIPNCWSTYGGNGGTNEKWKFGGTPGYNMSSAQDHTGNSGTFAWVDGSVPNNNDATLETPQYDVSTLTSPGLTFWFYSHNSTNLGDNVTLKVDLFDGANWNPSVFTYSGDNMGWTQYSVPLSGYNITGPVQFRFIVDKTTATTAFYNDVLLDDVTVQGNVTAVDALTELKRGISIYPNPTEDNLNIQLNMSGILASTVTLIDLQGRELLRQDGIYEKTSFDMSDFAPGIYLVHIEYDGMTVTHKVIRQ